MIVLGLTGSIGMGKSTTLAMFSDLGIPVYSADAAVHELYRDEAVPLIEAAFPGTVTDNVVDRAKLSVRVVNNPAELRRLEKIVHPLVREKERQFIARARADGAKIAVVDIPLLFETSARSRVDRVLVVTADAATQRKRVIERPGMTKAKFEAILARQVPDAEKRANANYIIDTSKGLDQARAEVKAIVETLSGSPSDA